MHAIEVRQLTKRFGTLTAVNGVSFTVERGEVLGFLEPSGGYARVYGHDVMEAPIEAKRKLGYFPEGAPLYGEMTPRGFLEFIAAVRGQKGSEARRRIAQVVEKAYVRPTSPRTRRRFAARAERIDCLRALRSLSALRTFAPRRVRLLPHCRPQLCAPRSRSPLSANRRVLPRYRRLSRSARLSAIELEKSALPNAAVGASACEHRLLFHSCSSRRNRKPRPRRSRRLVQAPFGVSPEFTVATSLGESALDLPRRYVLHVGSLIPRKNPGFLAELFADLALRLADLHLVQVGGSWTAQDRQRFEHSGLASRVHQLGNLSRTELAQVYRRASLVLLPSLAEGFGFPMIEALACGAVVLASDLPALGQVGGEAVVYRSTDDRGAWFAVALDLLHGRCTQPLGVRLSWSQRYGWARHAEIIIEAYRRRAAHGV